MTASPLLLTLGQNHPYRVASPWIRLMRVVQLPGHLLLKVRLPAILASLTMF